MATLKIKDHFKRNWLQTVNMIILFLAYANLDEDKLPAALVALWFMVLVGYYGYKLFKK